MVEVLDEEGLERRIEQCRLRRGVGSCSECPEARGGAVDCVLWRLLLQLRHSRAP